MKVKAQRQYREGEEAAERFDASMRRILSVPKAELLKREAAVQATRRTRKSRHSSK
jgi:hypothetical protein